MRVLVSAATFLPEKDLSRLRAFSDSLDRRYAVEADGVWGYNVRKDAPTPNRYYDDNGGMLIALMEAYDLTHEAVYLERAKQVFQFMLSGEDEVQGGGIPQWENIRDRKVATATVQAAMGALMLYKATGEPEYLDHAHRLYDWLKATLQDKDGLFFTRVEVPSGELHRVKEVHNAAYPIIANLLFYDVHGDEAYLNEAVRIARAAEEPYFETRLDMAGRGSPGLARVLAQQGRWAFKLIDAYVELYRRTGETHWIKVSTEALKWVHDRVQDGRGHYGSHWGVQELVPLERWELIDQAAVARAYWRLAEARAPELLAAVTDFQGVDKGGRR